MVNIQIVAIVIAIVIVLYLLIFVLQRATVKKVNALLEQKEQLASLKVRDELIEGRKLSLTGESLKQYQKLETDYNDVENNKFLKIDEQANLVLFEARGINFWKTRSELERLEAMVEATEQSIRDVRGGLNDLKKIDEERREAVNQLKKKYGALRQDLQERADDFGPAADGLHSFLDQLEDDYAEFTKLTDDGDHASASDIYEQLGMETTQLEGMLEQVPPLFARLNRQYPDQLAELQQGYRAMKEEGFVFPQDSIGTELQEIEAHRNQNLALLGELKLKEVAEQNGYIEHRIDTVYDTLQTEIDASQAVQQQTQTLTDVHQRVTEQNQILAVELDRLGQSFQLANGELEQRRNLLEQIRELDAQMSAYRTEIKETPVPFSELQVRQGKWVDLFNAIENEQRQIWENVSQLEPAEREARQLGGQFKSTLDDIRRQVEHVNLPGLPASYLEYYFAVQNEIGRLADSLTVDRIDMDDVQRQLNIVSADIDTLKERTETVIDQAHLTERMLQYANRFRSQNERVAQASEQARGYYERDYNYAKALEIIAPALDEMEPNVSQKITDQYYRHKNSNM
jgi:septation ring formation regulator